MRVLAVGGSGYVAGLTLPLLAPRFQFRVFDRQPPPPDLPCDYLAGDVRDPAALERAMTGCDALLYMAMGCKEFRSPEGALSAFDVNVTGLYLALRVAQDAGIRRAVVTSSMSVYEGLCKTRIDSEDEPADAMGVYGLTKRLGEEACQAAASQWGMHVVTLRLCLPVSAAEWMEKNPGGEPTIMTEASDTARAIEAALLRDGEGFEAFMISGDYTGKHMSLRKAEQLLDWRPMMRPETAAT
ncbi:MAG: NAD(P)-dependent oxidoreductase [Armatimonadetes bacterium]|nr:NAD(P)-dependent oxidoreductase [Armatimonadota bacterium]MDE2206117.1 NAD(P)-dependent oxidoreductase [Armatimonadota bacterium]